MTELEIILIVAGIAVMVVSFLIGERIDGTKENRDVPIDKEEIKNTVRDQVDQAVEESIDETVEKTAAELDKLSNEKIMAVSDYSEDVLNEINKNHEEVMFLYGMLNDKEEQIKNTVKDIEMVKASVKQMQQDVIAAEKEKETKSVREQEKEEKEPEMITEEIVERAVEEEINILPVHKQEVLKEERDAEVKSPDKAYHSQPIQLDESMNNNEKILALYQQGMENVDIAKKLHRGVGEVRLVIDLYRTRGKIK